MMKRAEGWERENSPAGIAKNRLTKCVRAQTNAHQHVLQNRCEITNGSFSKSKDGLTEMPLMETIRNSGVFYADETQEPQTYQ